MERKDEGGDESDDDDQDKEADANGTVQHADISTRTDGQDSWP